MLPPPRLRDAEHLLLRAALDRIAVLHGLSGIAALHGDPVAAIAVTIALIAISTITLKVDLAMTTVLLAALGGDAAAALTLAHVLRDAQLDHPFADDLAVSWLRHIRRPATHAAPLTARPSAPSERGFASVSSQGDLS